MENTERQEFSELLTATMEVYSARLTAASIAIWWNALERYPLAAIRTALSTHVQTPQQGRFAPKPADIIGLLQEDDGHPGPEEAWALLAPALDNQGLSMVWTEPMRLASAVAFPLSDDPVAARMAFKEAYIHHLADERKAGRPVSWSYSPGTDAAGHASCILENVRNGKLLPSQLDELPEHIAGQISDEELLRLNEAAQKRRADEQKRLLK